MSSVQSSEVQEGPYDTALMAPSNHASRTCSGSRPVAKYSLRYKPRTLTNRLPCPILCPTHPFSTILCFSLSYSFSLSTGYTLSSSLYLPLLSALILLSRSALLIYSSLYLPLLSVQFLLSLSCSYQLHPQYHLSDSFFYPPLSILFLLLLLLLLILLSAAYNCRRISNAAAAVVGQCGSAARQSYLGWTADRRRPFSWSSGRLTPTIPSYYSTNETHRK